ncbi:MAG TPA: hypothetical protein VLH56_04520 [Dissulfurispiraceae bacterium]|jgi:hypothetical protein|nr:hypothetical protein [Dissulfurispiraceae bacterium]
MAEIGMLDMLMQCKLGLGIQTSETVFDGVLMQKITAVKSFLRGAGVAEAVISGDDAVGVIVMGVGDIWNQAAGEVKFSPAFTAIAAQLRAGVTA